MDKNAKADIASRNDIIRLVDAFYDKVKQDDTIGFIFNTIIGSDWSHHLPVMYDFWTSVLLQTPAYTGNPIKKHIETDKRIRLEEIHYKRWLELWNETVDALYSGSIADESKKRAALMMELISTKVQWAREGKAIQ